ncbi:MAG TPA: GNAT family N-acetyltransferase [Burkholderiaceae bacterium]|jgi:GNAT superfamily N-acetyltransferase|nr:GNAT family N-acetyltransferase [Burkholderiaceae bacterium]
MSTVTRELNPTERASLLAHLLAMPAEDRRLRFAHAIADEGLQRYVEGIDFARDTVFVATDAELNIIGAAHLARDGEHAELGVSVLAPARGQGIGAALLERSATHARNAGVRVLFMNCLVENAPMLHLARKQGLQVAVSSGEAEAFVRLPRPSLRSLASEAVADHLGLIDHAHKAHWVALRGLWLASFGGESEPPRGGSETQEGSS